MCSIECKKRFFSRKSKIGTVYALTDSVGAVTENLDDSKVAVTTPKIFKKGLDMKKRFFLITLMASMLMLIGCGGGGSSSTTSNGTTSEVSTPSDNSAAVVSSVSSEEAAVTTPRNLYNISDKIGTPPSLPAE